MLAEYAQRLLMLVVRLLTLACQIMLQGPFDCFVVQACLWPAPCSLSCQPFTKLHGAEGGCALEMHPCQHSMQRHTEQWG
jgi:hypothetical protein